MNTGCPRAPVQDAALQLLQLLDQRFFGNIRPLPAAELDTGKFFSFVLIFTSFGMFDLLYFFSLNYF